MKKQALFLTAALALAPHASALNSDPATFSIVPANPSTADLVRVRMETSGCYHHPFGVRVSFEQRVLEVVVFGQDYSCDPTDPANVASPRLLDVCFLPAGKYSASVLSCVPAPPPQDLSCSVLEKLDDVVVLPAEGSTPAVVPTASTAGLGLLALGCLLFGAHFVRDRTRS